MGFALCEHNTLGPRTALYVAPGSWGFVWFQHRGINVTLPIPNAPELANLRVFAQAFVQPPWYPPRHVKRDRVHDSLTTLYPPVMSRPFERVVLRRGQEAQVCDR